MAMTILYKNSLPKYFRIEVVNTTCNVQNKILIRLLVGNTFMNYREGKNQTFHTFIHLDVSVLSSILMNKLENFDSKKNWRFVTYHPQNLTLSEKTEGVKTISSFKNQKSYTFIL
ncbi:hypothetical protein CR513_35294, partial [Mucuna pruriens]